jgi:methionine-S-sulfoxide reductase
MDDLSIITLGGGCFWCIEALFEKVEGVENVVSGYAAGKTPNPTYEEVCSGRTGHAEVVQIHFDPNKVSTSALYEHFFKVHDPTTLNQQGADRGSQYRSIILCHDESQQIKAEEAKKNASKLWNDPVVTEIEPLDIFYEAEGYHQDYFRRNPNQPYCAAVIAPKLAKF